MTTPQKAAKFAQLEASPNKTTEPVKRKLTEVQLPIAAKRQKPLALKKQLALPLRKLSAESRKIFDARMSDAEHVNYHGGFKGFCVRYDMHSQNDLYEACSWQDGASWLTRGVDSKWLVGPWLFGVR